MILLVAAFFLDAITRLSLCPSQPQILFIVTSFTIAEVVARAALVALAEIRLTEGPSAHGLRFRSRVVDHVRELATASIDEPVGNLICRNTCQIPGVLTCVCVWVGC